VSARRAGLLGAAAAALAGCSGDLDFLESGLFQPPPPPVALVQVSGLTSLANGCDLVNSPGTNYASSEVEPFLAINPADPDNFVGTWQQDRWSNGGARGDVAGVSFDGGQTWETRTAPFSRCTGGNSLNGGDYARATDPWVSFGPSGIAYWMAMSISGPVSAMLVSRSTDGGDTWEAPITLINSDDPFFNDKNSLTADPTDADYAYATWDRLDATIDGGPAWLARTTDGGATWEPASLVYNPGSGSQTIGNIVAVLPDGTLLLLFTEIQFAVPPVTAFLRVLRSTDKGVTWSAPITIDEMFSVGTQDPDTGQQVRSGGILGSISVAPNGDVWVAWQDSRPFCFACTGLVDRIIIARSTDGGLTWDDPLPVAPPNAFVAQFTPSVHVAADGTVGVTYYDLRDDVSGDGHLLTSYFLATSTDGATWTERLISGPFDLGIAPDALGLFVGDYEGLASSGNNFVPFFAQTVPDLDDRTNVFSVVLPTTASPLAKAALPVHRAQPLPPPVVSPEWRTRIQRNIDYKRKQPPDYRQPGALPKYLRRLT
jgi:hypothetical protein